jgi:hypothetical protein
MIYQQVGLPDVKVHFEFDVIVVSITAIPEWWVSNGVAKQAKDVYCASIVMPAPTVCFQQKLTLA